MSELRSNQAKMVVPTLDENLLSPRANEQVLKEPEVLILPLLSKIYLLIFFQERHKTHVHPFAHFNSAEVNTAVLSLAFFY